MLTVRSHRRMTETKYIQVNEYYKHPVAINLYDFE